MISIEDVSLKVRNFKCFSESAQGFDRIKPINVIIGRNNSGKSTLLDLVEHVANRSSIAERGHKGQIPQTLLAWTVLAEHLQDPLANEAVELKGGSFNPRVWADGGLKGKKVVLELSDSGGFAFQEAIGFDDDDQKQQACLRFVGTRLARHAADPFNPYAFQRIVADRDIVPEANASSLSVAPNGIGVTNVIQRYINHASLPSDLVETTLLHDLNVIFQPDADYKRIVVQQLSDELWEINLEEPGKGRIPISQMGSGLKTVLMVLANLHLFPAISKKPLSELLFGFEELENNLHPAIQRRLFRYLRGKAVKEGCHFFITTHSSVVIDLFSEDDQAQLIHVTHDGESATASVVETSTQGRNVLDDLDVRASDLLQTNAVVWVEGPSDRLYFNKWIELWSEGELIEGIHYQCLLFGGSLNAHLSFDSPELVDEMIATLKINRHAIVLMDSDKRNEEDKLKKHTQRISDEVSEVGGYAWVTAGREVENYIPATAFQKLFNNNSLLGPKSLNDVFDYVKRHDGKKKPRKVALARKVIPHITRDSIAGHLDLGKRLTAVTQKIGEWNRLLL